MQVSRRSRRNLQKRTISLVVIGDSYELLRQLYLKYELSPMMLDHDDADLFKFILPVGA